MRGAARRRGIEVVAADDTVDDAERALAAELGVELVVAPDDRRAAPRSSAPATLVVPAPGVPETHPLFAVAAPARPSRAQRDRAGLPVGAGAARRAAADARRHRHRRQDDDDAAGPSRCCEAGGVRAVGRRQHRRARSSRRSTSTSTRSSSSARASGWRGPSTFRGDAAVWLNLAPDHLNWHTSMATYEAAKARIFAQQRPDRRRHRRRRRPGRDGPPRGGAGPPPHVRPATAPTTASPAGDAAAVRRARWRRRRCAAPGSLPHDLTNGLAAAALVLETGLVGPDAVAAGLASFTGPPHRIELVGEADGVRWFNDSKATTPHAASAAIRAFDRVVLIAGGLNKGLDLRPMAGRARRGSGPSSPSARRRATSPTRSPASSRSSTATSMAEAVERAGDAGPARRRRAALARLRQLRLVPRRRLPGARRRLPPPRGTHD